MKNRTKLFNSAFALILIYCAVFAAATAKADVTEYANAKTPNDVYEKIMLLKKYVIELRYNKGVKEGWPEVPKQFNKAPRHALQKCIEILEKINRLRIIKHAGQISIPPFPSRLITPNEVYEMANRLAQEIKLALKIIYNRKVECEMDNENIICKTLNDIYQELWSVSYAIDPVLGIRGFNPNDVYAQTIRIISEINYLRLTQDIPLINAKPPLTQGKHPNHSLAESYNLLKKIALAERNLWIEPVNVPTVPRRIIKPPEVHDALQVALAELQRIKHRLGVEKHFITPTVEFRKTPDDVIQNIKLAVELMPDFGMSAEITQYDRDRLRRTTNHLFTLTAHILNEIDQYRMVLGIKKEPVKANKMPGLEQRHVYQKILECMEKVNALRLQKNYGSIATPEFPLRIITSNEVYDLARRLDSELEIVYNHEGIEEIYDFETLMPFLEIYANKRLNDVYMNVKQISRILDKIIGDEAYTLNAVYTQAQRALSEIGLVAKHLKVDFIGGPIPLHTDLNLNDSILRINKLLETFNKVNIRAGMFTPQLPLIVVDGNATPRFVFNNIRALVSELEALKAHLGIVSYAGELEIKGKITPAHICQSLEKADLTLLKIIGLNGE